MKKRYIILSTFFDMGGGQLYVRNKVDYLQKKSWYVDVYTGRSGKLLIPEMEKYKDNYYPELDDFPFYFSKKKQENIIKKVIGTQCFDVVIIESSKAPYAVWGEMIAKKMNAKHMFFSLDEDFPRYDVWYYDFVNFKHLRREIAGILPGSLQKMFNDYKIVKNEEDYSLKFICQNEISKKNDYFIDNIKKADVNLSCISRLNKDYILPMIEEVIILSKKHSEKSFSLILVGDAKDPTILGCIKQMVMGIDNLRLHTLGYLSPIPQSLIDRTDIFIGTSGSAVMTAAAGKITVAVDTLTCHPIGIYGYNTENATFLETRDRMISLSAYLECLCQSADRDKIIKKIRQNDKIKMDYMKEFDVHIDFIKESEKTKKYFVFNNFKIVNVIVFFIVKIIGVKNAKIIKQRLYLIKRAVRSWR